VGLIDFALVPDPKAKLIPNHDQPSPPLVRQALEESG